MKEIQCPRKHRVPIPDDIRAIDKCIAGNLDKFIGRHDIAKVEVNTWKSQGVPDYVTNKKHEAKVTVHLLIEGEVRWNWKRT